jgi:ribonuclease BN (tRNA processing enzyme)
VILANDLAYVVDCGDGVARQLAIAEVPLTTLRHIFITHQHSDHNADYGNLIWLAWAAGLHTRVDTWGPVTVSAAAQRETMFTVALHPSQDQTGEKEKGSLFFKGNLLFSRSLV